jgi:hypothetical protein
VTNIATGTTSQSQKIITEGILNILLRILQRSLEEFRLQLNKKEMKVPKEEKTPKILVGKDEKTDEGKSEGTVTNYKEYLVAGKREQSILAADREETGFDINEKVCFFFLLGFSFLYN